MAENRGNERQKRLTETLQETKAPPVDPRSKENPGAYDPVYGVRYVVVNENTLGYIYDVQPDSLNVLAGSVIKGGRSPLNGPTFIGANDQVRPATLADFETFRVHPSGHLYPHVAQSYDDLACVNCRIETNNPPSQGKSARP